VPSFVNELSRRVSIHRSIAYPIVLCVALYIVIGLTGAASFRIDTSSDLLATLAAADQNKTMITIVNILFPISVLVTSVPVFAIVIRYNLVRGNLCSNGEFQK
jgi:amino acid permease